MAQQERRILLVGRNNAGKSATGNTILMRKRFPLSKTAERQTTEFCLRSYFNKATQIKYSVLDTPGIADEEGVLTEARHMIQQAATDYCQRPHVILLVVDPDECQQLIQIIDALKTWFGRSVFEHTIAVFTKGTSFKTDNCFRDFIRNNLPRLFDIFDNRVVRVENHGEGRAKLQRELLSMIENTCNNGRSLFRCTPKPFTSSHKSHAYNGHDRVADISDANARKVSDENKISPSSSTGTIDENKRKCFGPAQSKREESRRGTYSLRYQGEEEGDDIEEETFTALCPAEGGATSKLGSRRSYDRQPLMAVDVKKTAECMYNAGVALRNIKESPLTSVTQLALLASDEDNINAVKNVVNSEEVQTVVENTKSFLKEAASAFGNFVTEVAEEAERRQRQRMLDAAIKTNTFKM